MSVSTYSVAGSGKAMKSCSGGQALGVYSAGNCAGVKPGRGGIRDHLGGSLWLQVERW